jgi:hypothetical protein
MREIPPEKMALYGGSVVAAILLSFVLRFLPRMRKPPIWIHFLYLVIVGVTLRFLPEWIQDEFFSPGGVVLVGTILPIYSSIIAVCSIDSEDDVLWLQFWMLWGSLSFFTEFMDDITAHLPQAGEHWFEFELWTVVWLILPLTNGTAVLYDLITKPYLLPLAQRLAIQMKGWIKYLLTLVNTSYIWVIWYAFARLPDEQRRFIVVALGTAYPMAASIVAISQTSESEKAQPDSTNGPSNSSFLVTKWLTYWSCYMLLFVAMDYLENFLGHIFGFYSMCGCATLYLALPMFNGAEAVFRRVLVPLSGQYEHMLLRDVWLVRQQIVASIPNKNRANVLSRAAAVFLQVNQPENAKKES